MSMDISDKWEFIKEFCDKKGKIDWDKIVMFNSGNLTQKDKEEFK